MSEQCMCAEVRKRIIAYSFTCSILTLCFFFALSLCLLSLQHWLHSAYFAANILQWELRIAWFLVFCVFVRIASFWIRCEWKMSSDGWLTRTVRVIFKYVYVCVCSSVFGWGEIQISYPKSFDVAFPFAVAICHFPFRNWIVPATTKHCHWWKMKRNLKQSNRNWHACCHLHSHTQQI